MKSKNAGFPTGKGELETMKPNSKSKWVKHFKKYHFLYGFLLFSFLGSFFVHSGLGPEWLLRLVLGMVTLVWGIGWALRLGLLAPASELVRPALLEPGLEGLRWFWEGIVRVLFVGIGVSLLTALFPLGKGVFNLLTVGNQALVVNQCTVEDIHSLGATGFIYQIVYVKDQPKSLDFFWGFGDFLHPGKSYQFLMLKDSDSILQVKHLSD